MKLFVQTLREDVVYIPQASICLKFSKHTVTLTRILVRILRKIISCSIWIRLSIPA